MTDMMVAVLFVLVAAGFFLMGYGAAMDRYWIPKFTEGMNEAKRIHDSIYGSHGSADPTKEKQEKGGES